MTHHQKVTAAEAEMLRRRVRDHMLATRGGKYEKWVQGLDAGRTFLRSRSPILMHPFFVRAVERLEIVDTLYAVMRMVDDYVDGDAPLPRGWATASAYVEHLRHFIETPQDTEDEMSRLLGYVLDLGRMHKMELRSGSQLILGSMLFDAHRRECPTLVMPSRAQLRANYDMLDSDGTIGLCLTILEESRESFAAVSLLGEATRVMYTLRDLREDMYARLCNVPHEDFKLFGMSVPDGTSMPAIQNWYDSRATRAWRSKEAQRGLDLYKAYDAQRDSLRLHMFTRGILEYLYERSTKAGLEESLQAA